LADHQVGGLAVRDQRPRADRARIDGIDCRVDSVAARRCVDQRVGLRGVARVLADDRQLGKAASREKDDQPQGRHSKPTRHTASLLQSTVHDELPVVPIVR